MTALTASRLADLQIPKLTINNYKVWSELATEALKRRAVWEYTQGEVARPEEKDQLQMWVQNNTIASGTIKETLSESQLGHVIGIESAKDVWDKLKTTAPNEPKLSGKFVNAQMQKSPSPPRFEDKYEEREYLKGRLTLAFHIFSKLGFNEGVAGHINTP